MRMRNLTAAALVVLATFTAFGVSTVVAGGASADEQCPKGQPPGRQPGHNGDDRGNHGRPQYPPGKCKMRLDKSQAAAGETVTASGDSFSPGSRVTVRLADREVAATNADQNGSFSVPFTVPADTAPGQYDVTAEGASSDGTQVLSAVLTVTGADGASGRGAAGVPSGNLPRTGSSSTVPLTTGAIGLVLIGMSMVVLARRRRHQLS